MTNISRAFAVLVFGVLAATPVLAQDTMPAPSSADQATAPAAAADMTGQHVYNSEGDWFGTVSSMTTDAHGQRLAAVLIERRLGIQGTTVLFPVGSLQPRDKGGYMTNLTGDQIKQLPKANATNTQ